MHVGLVLKQGQGFADQIFQAETGLLNGHLARFDAGIIEDVVDQVEQAVTGLLDHIQIVLLIVVQRRALEHVHGADDAIQRGANFVAHYRQEFTACTQCAVQFPGAFIHALFQYLVGFALNAGILALQYRHPVSQREGQQHGFGEGAQLHGIFQ